MSLKNKGKLAIEMVMLLLFSLILVSCKTSALGEALNKPGNSIIKESTSTAIDTKKDETKTDDTSKVTGPSVHYIDVGQGDSILIKYDKGNILIDGGENDKGEIVVNYLKNQGIKELEYVVATHPHSDHIGGLDYVLDNIKVNNVLIPKVTHTTKTYEDLLNSIKSNNVKLKVAKSPDSILLGDLKLDILNPINESYDNLNNYSVVIKMSYKNVKFLFTGDAEALVEKDMINAGYNLEADVLKVGHHGSTTSTSKSFLDKVNPSIAVISVGNENDYGHPNQKTLDLLNSKNISILRTDLLGTVVINTDGEKVYYDEKEVTKSTSTENVTKENVTKDVETKVAPSSNTTDSKTYVDEKGNGTIKGNINSSGEKIYHMPGGSYYEKTKAEKYFKTEKEAVENGYRKSSR